MALADEMEEISLERRGDTFARRRLDSTGAPSEIKLADTNFLALLPLIQKACAEILEARIILSRATTALTKE